MDTVEVRRAGNTEQIELVLRQGSTHKIGPSILSRSHVFSHLLQADAEDRSELGTVQVPEGYLAAWLSHIGTGNEQNVTATEKLSLCDLLHVLKVCRPAMASGHRRLQPVDTVGVLQASTGVATLTIDLMQQLFR